MQVRKKPANLRKPSHPRGGWAEWRSAKGAPAIFRRPKKGESGYHRVRRLVDETPGCGICGSSEGLTSRTVDGKAIYRCPAHFGVVSKPRSQQLISMPTRGKRRVSISQRKKDVSGDGQSE